MKIAAVSKRKKIAIINSIMSLSGLSAYQRRMGQISMKMISEKIIIEAQTITIHTKTTIIQIIMLQDRVSNTSKDSLTTALIEIATKLTMIIRVPIISKTLRMLSQNKIVMIVLIPLIMEKKRSIKFKFKNKKLKQRHRSKKYKLFMQKRSKRDRNLVLERRGPL